MIISSLYDIWKALKEFRNQAMIFALYAAAFYVTVCLVIYFRNVIKNKERSIVRQVVVPTCLFVVLAIYLSYLISITLSGREPGSRVGYVNLVVFSTLFNNDRLNLAAFENVLLFIPFGIIIPIIYEFFRKWWNLILGAFITSTIIETMQLATSRGYFELDDIILNSFGAFIGFLIFTIIYYSFRGLAHRIRHDDGYHHGVYHHEINKNEEVINRYTLFIIQLLPVIIVLLAIFRFSSDDGVSSTKLSAFVAQRIVYILNAALKLGLSYEGVVITAVAWEPVVRTLAHFSEYALLSFFTFILLYCRRIRCYISNIVTIIFCVIIAVLDEINQLGIAGRNGSRRDIFIDFLGVAFVLLIIDFIIALQKINRKWKSEKINE